MSFSVYHHASVDRSEGASPHEGNGVLSLQSQPDGVEGSQAEILAACEQAAEILAAALGRPSDRIRVTFSGHANPGHAPCSGWADEFAQVAVYVSAAHDPDFPDVDLRTGDEAETEQLAVD